MKLDIKDKRILQLLEENARLSNSQIARKIKLSKPAVEYRIKRLQKNNQIFKFFTTINFTKLGYSQYKIYFKFQNTSLEEERKIINYWIKDFNSIWVAQIRGRWDLAVSVLATSNFEFGKTLNHFMNKFSKFILEKDILLTEYSPLYSRRHIDNQIHETFKYGKPEEVYKIDETDQRILKAISNNSRIQILSLSEQLKLSRDIISYRLKKLQKENIIIGFNLYPNLNELGLKHYKVILRTKNFDEENEKQLGLFITSHKKATQFLKLIGSWDVEIEFETENEDELYKILNELRNKFSNIIRDFDIIRIVKTEKYDYFPF